METNIYLRQYPFIRIIIPMLSGIILQIFIPVNFYYLPVLFTLTYILIILSPFLKFNYKFRWIFGTLLNIFLFLSGIELVNIQYNTNNLPSSAKKESIAIGTVIQTPDETGKNIKTLLNISRIKINNNWRTINFKSIAFFQKDSLSAKIDVGDQIAINSKVLCQINNLKNPNEFDYKKYLSAKLITSQAFIKSDMWKLIKKNEGNYIFLLAYRCRNFLLNTYKKYGLKNSEFAVVSALTIGYKDKLDAEIKHAYSSSGAMHILCVSGLHVGIIFIVFNYILFFLEKIKAGRIIKPVFIICFIWFYSVIVGMSPSIMRAALMITFVIAGKYLKRSSNIYNSILSSAFILLLINPFYILTVGFQFSYIAITGIVFFTKRFNSILNIRNLFLNKLWKLISVSIAVQLAVSPISIYYFHQFPNYFLIANFIVIPLGTIILYLAVLLYIFSFFPSFALIIGKLLIITTKTLNLSVMYVEHLPYSVTSGITISLYETFIIYLLIILITLYFLYKNVMYINFSFALIILLLCIKINNKYSSFNQKKFIVYNYPGTSLYNFVSGTNNILFFDYFKSNKEFLPKTIIKDNLIKMGVKNGKIINLQNANIKNSLSKAIVIKNNNVYYKNNFLSFFNKTFLFICNNDLKHFCSKNKFNIDYIILANNNKIKIKELTLLFNINQIIIDSSNSRYMINRWSDECNRYGIKCWIVSKDGAFISNF